MVLQQCLACNNLVTELLRACGCGHVFEGASRLIGGKRFSEYRAKLYSRLETKRMRRNAQENKSNTNPQSRITTNSPALSLKPNRRSSERNISDKRKRRKRYSRLQTNPASALKRQPSRGNIVSPELLSRLPSALKEINRKIFVQNIMWLALQKD